MHKNSNGIFTISLDFELYWGMKDTVSVEKYADNIRGVPFAVDALLKSFHQYDIHATWAIVGFLYFKDLEELKKNLPHKKPSYQNEELDLYRYIDSYDSLISTYHFAPDTIEKIIHDTSQEIGTHTFSHYYCLEEGQTKEEFYSDIEYAVKVTKDKTGKDVKSLVFPRNQWNDEYLSVLSDLDILCYRGNEESWIYNAVCEEKKTSPLRRILRLLDSYFNITGHNTYTLEKLESQNIFNIPASRFLRPASKPFNLLEKTRLQRIKSSMTYAAKHRQLFHLWWHPHNFGKDIETNMAFLKKILEHYKTLHHQYNMQSLNMGEVASLLQQRKKETIL
jgi:peptidoglycan/xylan/chitin deacetylase (PgdA/CDA1 family)